MAEPQKKKRIDIPREYDETDRLKVGRLVIERIIERTAQNLDVNGKRFSNYSDSYSKSLEFKIAGKKQNDPNLRLSGDMLDSLSILETGPGFVTVGYNEGTAENDKAAWAEATDKTVQRKFLGVSESELEVILAQVRSERPTSLRGLADQEAIQRRILSSPNARSATQSFIDRILQNYTSDTTSDEGT